MILKRILPVFLVAAALIFPGAAGALADSSIFSDMPDDYSASALEAAAANGLLKGSGGKILPDENLTRAELSAIVVTAFGAEKESSLSDFKDVSPDAWYYSALARAVYMKALSGTGSTMQPNSPVTREQAMKILASALGLGDGTSEDLAAFKDAASVSGWAVGAAAAMVKAGYISGSGGNLNPKAGILRKDFAVIMNRIISVYISKAGTYTAVGDGTVMVNVPDVTLMDVTITGNLIIGDGVGDGKITLQNVTVNGATIVRGGTIG